MKTFACMAEAVAFYVDQGYSTLDSSTTDTRRVMYKTGDDQLLAPMVELLKVDFLLVEARYL
jgi:hypothetical protein